MQVNSIKNTTNPSFKGILNSNALRRGLEFASDNGALFAAGTALALSTVVRPIAILATPNVEKENKQYAFAKSVASSLVGFGIMAAITTPIVKAVKQVGDTPKKFMNKSAIRTLKDPFKPLHKSAPFKFSAQGIKLGSAFLTTFPKAFLTCALIPPVMGFFFKKDAQKSDINEQVSFGKALPSGIYNRFTNSLSNGVGKILNQKPVQEFAKKHKNSNIAQHTFSLNDIFATGLFAYFTSKNKNIKEDRKKTLIYNASIMTGLTIAAGYGANKLLDKPTEIFIQKFKQANKGAKKLDKYVEGIKIAKPALILGGLYYLVAPIISTALAEVLAKDKIIK